MWFLATGWLALTLFFFNLGLLHRRDPEADKKGVAGVLLLLVPPFAVASAVALTTTAGVALGTPPVNVNLEIRYGNGTITEKHYSPPVTGLSGDLSTPLFSLKTLLLGLALGALPAIGYSLGAGVLVDPAKPLLLLYAWIRGLNEAAKREPELTLLQARVELLEAKIEELEDRLKGKQKVDPVLATIAFAEEDP